jgi:large subunit ribosomal protein L10
VLKAKKHQRVEALQEVFSASKSLVVIHYRGMTVAEIDALRKKVREHGANFTVTKNLLTRRALAGTPFEKISEMFTGPTAIAYSMNEVSAAKAVAEYAKENEKVVLLGGGLPNEMMDVARVKVLASLPSLDELRAKIVGTILAPAQRLVGVLQAPGSQLARVMHAHASKP